MSEKKKKIDYPLSNYLVLHKVPPSKSSKVNGVAKGDNPFLFPRPPLPPLDSNMQRP